MKYTFFAIIVALGLSTLSAQQQPQTTQPQQVTTNATSVAPATVTTTPMIPEPEWPGRIYVFVGGRLVTLENQTPQELSKVSIIRQKVEAGFSFEKVTSPVRAPSNAIFVVKLEQVGNPPVYAYKLTPNPKSGARQVIIAKISNFKGNLKTDDVNVELNFISNRNGVVTFSSKSPLLPGEYAFITKGGQVAYLMGVD